MRRNSYTPILLTVNAVYWRESSDTLTCQKPLLRYMVEKYQAPTNDSMVSGHLGIGYESFFVWAFRFLKSMQNLRVPSFFLTSTMALHHGDWEGHTAPPSSISWMCWCTSPTSCSAILLNLSLNGSSCSRSNSITMFCGVHAAHLILFQTEDAVEFHQEPLGLEGSIFLPTFQFSQTAVLL